MRRLSKKGISPLIATVLLMAFAVALGGMIMNWTSKITDAPSGCEKVELEPITFCHTPEAISLRVRLMGEREISGLTLLIQAPNSSEIPVVLPDSALAPFRTFETSIPFLVPEGTKASLVAKINEHGREAQCPEPHLVQNPLPKC